MERGESQNSIKTKTVDSLPRRKEMDHPDTGMKTLLEVAVVESREPRLHQLSVARPRRAIWA